MNFNRLDKANGEIEFLKVAREKAEDDIARFRNELSSLTEARNKHVLEQERQNSEMHMLQNDIKVRILCLQFSLNPLEFSLKRETWHKKWLKPKAEQFAYTLIIGQKTNFAKCQVTIFT